VAVGILTGGEVPERLNGPVLKTGARKCRGFESHPLRQALHLAAVLLLAGCSVFGTRTFGYAFPADEFLDALPVTLTDQTGLVTNLDEAPADFQPLIDEGFQTVPGDSRAIVVHWLGGFCDSGVAIDARDTGTVTFTLTTTRKPGVCELGAIQRALRIDLARPLDPSMINFVIEP
jgi:hypothetical protein